MIERLIRRKPVVNAIGGLFGTGLAAFIAVTAGKAEGYFVPRDALPARAGRRLRRLGGGPAPARRATSSRTLYRAEPGWTQAPGGPAGDDRVHARVGRAVRAARRGLRDPDRRGQASAALAVASIAMGWPAFGAARCSAAIATCRGGSSSSARRRRGPSRLLERAGRRRSSRPAARWRRALAGRDQRRRPHAHVHPVRRRARRARARRSTPARTRSGARGRSSPGCARRSRAGRARAPRGGRGSMIALASRDARRPRAPEVLRERHQQHAVAARRAGTPAPIAWSAANAAGSQSRRAHVVDADVEAAEVVAGVRARGARLEGGELRVHDVGRRARRRRRRS